MIPNENPALPGEDKATPGDSQAAKAAQNKPQNGLTHLRTSAPGQKSGSHMNNLKIKIATINISSFTGKEEKLINTMIKRNLYVLGLSEIQVKEDVSLLSGGYRLLHKGKVAFILSPEAAERSRGVIYKGQNIMCVDLSFEHTELSIIQTYVPDKGKPVRERVMFYKALQDVYNMKKYRDNVILMGDFNGHVGTERKGKEYIVGPFSVGNINDPGKLLIEFCASNCLSIMNTFFMHDEKFKWTWYKHNEKSMIDFMISKNKYLFRDVKANPYLSYNSDHRMVVAKLSVKKPRHLAETKKIFKLENLANEDSVRVLREKVSIRMPRGNVERDIEEEWDFMKEKLNVLAKRVLKEKDIYRTRRKNASWWTDDLRKSKAEVWNTIGKDLEDNTLSTKLLVYSMAHYEKGGSPPWYTLGEESDSDNTEAIPRRWQKYFEALLNTEDVLNDHEANDNNVSEMEISLQETERAIQCMNSGLAPGNDHLAAEIFQSIGTDGAKWLRYVCNIAWKQEKIPSDWRKVIIAPVYKTVENTECGSYMGVSTLSHGGKVYERILEQRLRAQVEEKLGEWQHGFRPNRNAVDVIFSMRMVLEKSWEWRQSKYLAFIAFDNIPREQIWKALNHREYEIDPKLIRVIQSMYRQLDYRCVKSKDADMPVGIHQSGVLSPLLSIIFMDWCLKEICSCQKVKTFVHAGDVAIMADTRDYLQAAIDKWCDVMTQKGVPICTRRTVVMHVGKERKNFNIHIGDNKLKQVKQVKFLGVVFNDDNTQQSEVDNRIQRLDATEKLLRPLLADKMISEQLKVKIYVSFLRPILLYGCETWSVSKPSESKINAAEMNVLKTIYNVTKQNKPSDIEVRKKLEIIPISDIIEEKKLLWYGQIKRMHDTRFSKKFLRWIPPGIRPRGGSRTRWNLGIRKALEARRTNLKEVEEKRFYENQREWGELVHLGRERSRRTRN